MVKKEFTKKHALKSVRAINDKSVIFFLNNILKNQNLFKILHNDHLQDLFLKEYKKWILSSKLNNLKNLNIFKYSCFSQGSSQSFDYFYSKYKNRRFRAFKGDYAYHYVSWRNNFPGWRYIEDDNLKKNDAVVISLPFSDTGSKHFLMDKIILECEKKNIPVMIDCCYFTMCSGINFNFNKKCIKMVVFSLSKAFPVSRLRIGMRLTKKDDDDPLFFFKKLNFVNKMSIFIGLKLIKKFKFDYLYKKYYSMQKHICKKLDLDPSSMVNIGIGGKKWRKFNRGGKLNRVCLSRYYEAK